jgi:hypothetical protein
MMSLQTIYLSRKHEQTTARQDKTKRFGYLSLTFVYTLTNITTL